MSTAPSSLVRRGCPPPLPQKPPRPDCPVEPFGFFSDHVEKLFHCSRLLSSSNSRNVGAGDRLISVNDTNLLGLSHANAIDILQNAPDEVTLVVSQPKERLYRGERGWTWHLLCAFCLVMSRHQRVIALLPVLTEAASGYDAVQAKALVDTFDSDQDGESVDDLSEEHVRIESPSPPPHSSDAAASSLSPVRQQSSSPDSKTNAVKTKPNGVQQCLDRILAMAAASSAGQPHKPAANKSLDPLPPALPPKTRKAKFSEAPRVPECPDRGESDMDEENLYNGQGKVKKVGVYVP